MSERLPAILMGLCGVAAIEVMAEQVRRGENEVQLRRLQLGSEKQSQKLMSDIQAAQSELRRSADERLVHIERMLAALQEERLQKPLNEVHSQLQSLQESQTQLSSTLQGIQSSQAQAQLHIANLLKYQAMKAAANETPGGRG
ncbi:hypothetical protein GOP47_0007222 [Adiantum capillus-veneris]|uniref:Uncharacterized protein n=1 Tax=Adiantum capillus-veneris TaxID=13818 RepID=A0A9D4V0G9_ADICA|nr:hypothetical protein GOP47_0007222 [Adiantum capillus-veneris]